MNASIDFDPSAAQQIAGSCGSVCILRASLPRLECLMTRETFGLRADFNVIRVMKYQHSQNSHSFVDEITVTLRFPGILWETYGLKSHTRSAFATIWYILPPSSSSYCYEIVDDFLGQCESSDEAVARTIYKPEVTRRHLIARVNLKGNGSFDVLDLCLCCRLDDRKGVSQATRRCARCVTSKVSICITACSFSLWNPKAFGNHRASGICSHAGRSEQGTM